MGEPFQLGRYSLHAELASGGMATVYLARQVGAVGFGKTVAIKRLHPHLARDPYFVTMFLDEARLAARVQHPNVVPILDVVATDRELFLVLEYIKGETLSGLIRAVRKTNALMPIPIAISIIGQLLAGLHAAHEAKDERGVALNIVHRDVSPQNVLVGSDGIARVLDFGVAKAATRLQTTREGQLKGKIPYMAPEQLTGEVSSKTDVYAAGVVLWEALTAKRLFRGETEAQVLHLVMTAEIQPPSVDNPNVTPELDRVVLKALARKPEDRYATAREMATDLETVIPAASAMKVAEWMETLIGTTLAARAQAVREIESGVSSASVMTPNEGSLPQLPGLPGSISSMGPTSSPSTASLVMKTPASPPRPRWPYFLAFGIAGVAVLSAIAIGVVFIVFYRGTATRNAATLPPPTLSVAPSASTSPSASSTETVGMAITSATSPKPSATAVLRPTGHTTIAHPPPSHTPPQGTTTGATELLDSR